jgi:stage II sporulation protein E
MLSETLCQTLTEQNIGIEGAVVWGKKRRRIKLIASDRCKLLQEAGRLKQTIERVCSFPITEAQWNDSSEASIEFWEAERISVSFAHRTLCADGESEYCGDTMAHFRIVDGRFCALISDGMGSGQEAAVTSGISTLFLRKMLSAGSSCTTALEMLNCFLRNRGGGSLHECSATVDLMELDLLRSHASFYKCGAAPTYIFRDGSLFKIRSHTVPIGIIGTPDTRKLGFDVNVGDVIVMVSDGITQGKEECPWLFDLLRTQSERCDPERLADLIVKYAKGEECSDDISVLVIKLKNA